MKTSLRCGALSVLFVAACSSPNADLFKQGSSQPGAAGGDGKAVVSSAGSSAGDKSPDTNDTPAVDPSRGGAPATNDDGAAGDPSAPNTQGTAGDPSAPNTQGTAGDQNTHNTQGTAGDQNTPNNQGTAGSDGVAGGGGGTEQPPQPVCGNGILEAGEQCDDAGHAGLDGCDASCKVVCSQYGAGTVESEDYHCYAGYNQADFTGAQQDCVKRGAHLATISSAAENKIVRGLVDNSKWLGGYEDVPLMSAGAGSYIWLGGDPLSFSNWGAHEPDAAGVHCAGGAPNTLCYEHCISILGDGTWANHRCDMVDGYVCEWEPAGTK
jgi:cysteine-rich repeat protein